MKFGSLNIPFFMWATFQIFQRVEQAQGTEQFLLNQEGDQLLNLMKC